MFANLGGHILSVGPEGDPNGDLEEERNNQEKSQLQIARTMERAMNALDSVDRRPTIYMDSNGDGKLYAVLAYTCASDKKTSRHKVHLGNLPPAYIEQLREYIEIRWPEAPDVRVDLERIHALRLMARLAHSKMRTMTRGTGFHFHGHTLRKECQ